jgi:hypothetical protein
VRTVISNISTREKHKKQQHTRKPLRKEKGRERCRGERYPGYLDIHKRGRSFEFF